jgi:hypothetical protein
VQKRAAELGCVFFSDAGEGRDVTFEDMEGEDISGWLIPSERAKAFQDEWDNAQPSDQWLSFFRFAIWRIENGALLIDFKEFS